MTSPRGQWATKFGFIMAAAGSAVGLGNIWRFPYLTGQNGGAAFVILYIGCVLLVGLPVLMNEMALGRLTGKSTLGAFQSTHAPWPFRWLGGVLALCVSFFVFSYYAGIAGWTVGFMIASLAKEPLPFLDFIATPSYVLPLLALSVGVTLVIVIRGVSGGIEKATKILMPLLFIFLVVMIIRSLTLPGQGPGQTPAAGLRYYLIPDFGKITARTVLDALTQTFFSMGIGWGIMITYGSYLSKKESIVSASVWVGIMDSGIALLGGLMVFPAVFAFGIDPSSRGETLVFQALAGIFPQMPGGSWLGAVFFFLLFIAAITSAIAMVEVVASWFIDELKWSRTRATWVVCVAAFLVGIPSALSKGAVPVLSNITWMGNVGLQNIVDFAFGTIAMLIVVLATSVYSGWFFRTQAVADEIATGSPLFTRPVWGRITPQRIWILAIRFVCPLIILLVVLNMLGMFG